MAARLFCDPPLHPPSRDGLIYARKVLGHSGRSYSDCYCCWLMALSQPCLLSAGLSSKMDIAISFPLFFGGSELNPLYLSDVASWWVFITPNCFCAAGISSSPAPTLTHRCTAKRLWRRYFTAGPLSLAHIPSLLLYVQLQKRSIVWALALFPVCRSRVECCDPLCARGLDDGHMDFLLFRSLKPSTEVTFCLSCFHFMFSWKVVSMLCVAVWQVA